MFHKIRLILGGHSLDSDKNTFLKLRKKLQSKPNKIYELFLRHRYNKILYRNNASIPLVSKIGDNIIFPHGLSGIFISRGATIGNNCTIFHQVTIGSNTLADSKKSGAPTIGDNCYIGAGAKIIGNVHIGNNVRIGANAIVTMDIPDNATVVLEKPRIIVHNEKRDNSFVTYDNYDEQK